MITIDLSEAESEVLRQILEVDLSDLRMEIADTDSFNFRDDLKGRKEVLQKVLDSLGRK